jgi:hypothetical protein
MDAQAPSAYIPGPTDTEQCLSKAEVRVTFVIALTAVLKIAAFGSILSLLGDVAFLIGLCTIRSKKVLVMLLLTAAIAIPSVPGVDKIAGIVFYLEVIALVLAARVWLASGMSINFSIGKTGLAGLILYCLILLVSVVRANSLSDHLVTARYVLIMVMTAEVVRQWIKQEGISVEQLEEILFRSLRSGLLVYIVLFLLQFVLSGIYDQVFVASNGEREGTRVAYQVQGYIPVLALALLAIGTSGGKLASFAGFYSRIKWLGWFLLALFAVLATGARMALVQWFLIAIVFIFFKSIRSFLAVLVAGIAGLLLLNLPVFANIQQRMAEIADADSFAANLGARLLPALLAVDDMHGVDFLVGKGLNYKFFVPWFEVRADGFEAYSTFIDQLWATIFVQSGLVGCLLVLAVFFAGVKFLIKYADELKALPTIKFLILFYMAYVHGFSNLAYAKDVYVYIGFIVGSIGVFRASLLSGQSRASQVV